MLLPVVLTFLAATGETDPDRQAILTHIDGLFRAYFRHDLEAIRRGEHDHRPRQ